MDGACLSPAEQNPWQARAVRLLDLLAPKPGQTLSALDSVRFMRANQSMPRAPVLYEPSIVIVCQGRKRGFIGDEVYTYDAQQFLVLSVPLPFEAETEASPEVPLLAAAINLDLGVLAELVMAVDQCSHAPAAPPRGIVSTPLGAQLGDAVLRLFEVLTSPTDAQVLGPGIVREICYRVLTGEQGGAIRAALTHQGQFGKIGRALRRIHTEYASSLDVGVLAEEAAMSVAAFHANFKAVTSTSPIQYLKTTRLHKARLLMVRDGLSAASAADRVGYESPSQFSREFKRLFGRSPKDEARHMQEILALSAAEQRAAYVVAH